MPLTQRQRGYGSPATNMFLQRMIGAFSVNRRRIDGRARIVFPCGSTHPVEASLTHCHSAISAWGDGYFLCDAAVGFEALESSQWLTLAFATGASFEIEAYSAKATKGQCRCQFEVKS